MAWRFFCAPPCGLEPGFKLRCQLPGLNELGWGHLGGDEVAVLHSARIAGQGRKVVPLMSLHLVLRHAPTVAVHVTEAILRVGIPLVCGFAGPIEQGDSPQTIGTAHRAIPQVKGSMFPLPVAYRLTCS